jgi:cytochrome b pre-mRNA-processing protein 3
MRKACPVRVLSRIFGLSDDDRAPLRPLWNRVVEIARRPDWYARNGVADSVSGRFDMLTLVLALVLLRMEREPALAEPAARLTEIFVEDMDGQMRQTGVGDLVVGKRIGSLMGALGGRLGALREALASAAPEAALREVALRNVTLDEGGDAAAIGIGLARIAASLDGMTREELLGGRIPE